MTDDQNWVRIERVLPSPITDVWRLWTEPSLFKAWYGPIGMTVPVANMNVTVGGTRMVCMEMRRPDGAMQMWFTGVYKEITAPTRLVYTEAMCDAEGTLLPPSAMGMPGDTPDITEVIVDLEEIDGGTRMVMVHKGVPAGSAGEDGWNQAFDKLSAYLEAGGA